MDGFVCEGSSSKNNPRGKTGLNGRRSSFFLPK
jgi:hypothetical protein